MRNKNGNNGEYRTPSSNEIRNPDVAVRLDDIRLNALRKGKSSMSNGEKIVEVGMCTNCKSSS